MISIIVAILNKPETIKSLADQQKLRRRETNASPQKNTKADAILGHQAPPYHSPTYLQSLDLACHENIMRSVLFWGASTPEPT